MGSNRNSEVSLKSELRRKVGLRIVQLRKRRGWSQGKLAGRLEVSADQLRNWEKGVHAPSLEALVKLAEALEVTLEELVRGDAGPAPQVPPAQRQEARRCLNGFLKAIGWVQPAEAKEKEEMNSLRRHGGVDVRRR